MKPVAVTVVTAGHLSTCPRMLKAADALAEAGYDVHVVATKSTSWAAEADEDVMAARGGRFRLSVVDYRRATAPGVYLRSGLRRRLARSLASLSKVPSLSARAFSRVHDELVRAAVATEADFYYGGTTGGLAATREAARRTGVPFALDLEDFHGGEFPEGSLDERLAARVERATLGDASFLTTSSEAIAEAYRERRGVAPVVVHNVFPLPEAPPAAVSEPDKGEADARLELYWFSQTIGPGRGLEQAVRAAALSGVPIALHLRGRMQSAFRETLRELAGSARELVLEEHAPAPPDAMTALCDGYDVGLALEQNVDGNRPLCITNKVLTYPLAGLAVAMTRTPGHRPLVDAFGDEAIVCPPGDVAALAEGLKRLARDRRFLRACRERAWELARKRWHWEHADERGRLLESFRAALASTRR